jgi:hypothetical protein
LDAAEAAEVGRLAGEGPGGDGLAVRVLDGFWDGSQGLVEELGFEGDDAAILPEGCDKGEDGLGFAEGLGLEVVEEMVVEGVEIDLGFGFQD